MYKKEFDTLLESAKLPSSIMLYGASHFLIDLCLYFLVVD